MLCKSHAVGETLTVLQWDGETWVEGLQDHRRIPRRGRRVTVTVYHNPRCNTSRKTLALLEKQGVKPRVVGYLRTPSAPAELRQLLTKLGLGPHELLRKKEAALDKPDLSDAQLVAGMAKHPIAIERPIVVKGSRAALGRPP